MADFWKRISDWFKQEEVSSPSNPFIHELIERSPQEKEDLQFWQETLVRKRLSNWLNEQYAIFLLNPENHDESIDFLDTPSSKGFVIHLHHTQYSLRDARHFLDYLKNKVRTLGYRTQISDSRTYAKAEATETTERHYLKPNPKIIVGQKQEQKFGNITVSLVLRDNIPHQLFFQANTYQDRLFEEGLPFGKLFREVVN